jgi:hypothetical protein
MRGAPSLSFRLEEIQQVVPYEHIRELLGFQKGAPEKVDVPEGMLDEFWNLISGGRVGGGTNKGIPSGTPSSKYSTHGCVKGFWRG